MSVVKTQKRLPVKSLWVTTVAQLPIDFEFTSETFGFAWEFYPSDPFGDEEPEAPMMDYYYPLPDFVDMLRMRGWSLEEAGRQVATDLPLCIVGFGDEEKYGLALTGGGMDLSWEICEAHMRLGYLPPFHFASHLPRMADLTLDERVRWVIAGCQRSCQVMRRRAVEGARAALKVLKDLEHHLREG